MGHVFVDAEVSWTQQEQVRFLVDTGATHSVLPEDLAARLGAVRSPRTIAVTLADGSTRPTHFSTVLVRIGDREAAATALLVPAGAEPLLGVELLEAMGLAVDPVTKSLQPTRAHGVLAVGVRPNR
jgi:clan AA aspartic protease